MLRGDTQRDWPLFTKFGQRNSVHPLLAMLAQLVNPAPAVSDAYWAVTHPVDRLAGRGRAENGQMMMPFGGKAPMKLSQYIDKLDREPMAVMEAAEAATRARKASAVRQGLSEPTQWGRKPLPSMAPVRRDPVPRVETNPFIQLALKERAEQAARRAAQDAKHAAIMRKFNPRKRGGV